MVVKICVREGAMIATLFYPKELKEIIADLRSKDDLNEEFEAYFETIVIRRIALLVLFISIIGMYYEIYAAIIISILLPLLLKFDINHNIQDRILPYILGKRLEVEVSKIYTSGNGSYIEGIDQNGRKYRTKILPPSIVKRDNLFSGKKISAFHLTNSNIIMPVTNNIASKFCPIRNIVKKAENE